MPGAVMHRYELEQFTVTTNHEVRRDFGSPDLLEVGVGIPVELVGEQALDFVSAIDAWGQADRVDDGQVDGDVTRTRPEVR